MTNDHLPTPHQIIQQLRADIATLERQRDVLTKVLSLTQDTLHALKLILDKYTSYALTHRPTQEN